MTNEASLCRDRQLHHHITKHGRPQTAVVTAFDSAYVAAGSQVRDAALQLFLPFVGFCADADCVLEPTRRAGTAIVALCNHSAIDGHMRALAPRTERCLGWRRVQFVKVWGIHDVLHSGVDVLLLDGDRVRPSAAQLRLMQGNAGRIDTFVDLRDPPPWPGFWNFGLACKASGIRAAGSEPRDPNSGLRTAGSQQQDPNSRIPTAGSEPWDPNSGTRTGAGLQALAERIACASAQRSTIASRARYALHPGQPGDLHVSIPVGARALGPSRVELSDARLREQAHE